MADEIKTYCGKPLAECSREELIACIQSMARLTKTMLEASPLESHMRLLKVARVPFRSRLENSK